MFRWFQATRPKARATRRKSSRLNVEELDVRCCPTVTLNLSLTYLNDDTKVHVSGSVVSPNPGNSSIVFEDALNATVTTDDQGNFSADLYGSYLGTFQAVATDGAGSSSAPVSMDLTSMVPTVSANLYHEGGKDVKIIGDVYDEDPKTCVIHISGPVNETVTPNSGGGFVVEATASALGTIKVWATDAWQQESDPVSLTLDSDVPTLSLGLCTISNQQKTVILNGNVFDEDPGDCVVYVTGQINTVITPDDQGDFNQTFTVSGLGTVTVKVVDVWGQSSSVTGTITCLTPSLGSMSFSQGPLNVWTFQGYAMANDAWGMEVTWTGLPCVDGTTSIVQEDGSFSMVATIPNGTNGTVTATITDVWGQSSSASFTIGTGG